MTFKRSFTTDASSRDRRSGLNRRWIKASYEGAERRSGKDRRLEPPAVDAPLPPLSAEERMEALEKLLLSTTVRLEALARLLLEKRLLSEEDLADTLKAMYAEYEHQQLKD
jgi:hypothetical protein